MTPMPRKGHGRSCERCNTEWNQRLPPTPCCVGLATGQLPGLTLGSGALCQSNWSETGITASATRRLTSVGSGSLLELLLAAKRYRTERIVSEPQAGKRKSQHADVSEGEQPNHKTSRVKVSAPKRRRSSAPKARPVKPPTVKEEDGAADSEPTVLRCKLAQQTLDGTNFGTWLYPSSTAVTLTRARARAE